MEGLLRAQQAEQTEKLIDQAIVLQQSHPSISAQQEIHPHGQHDDHDHSPLHPFPRPGNAVGQRIGQQQADHRGDGTETDGQAEGARIV